MFSLVLALLALIWAPAVGAMTIEQVSGTRGVAAWLVEDHTLPVVSVRFAFPGGAALDPPGRGGLAAMAAALLDEGAGPYDTASFKTRLEDRATDLRFTAGRDEVGGSLRSLKANLPEAVGLLRAALTAPRFETAPVERVRGEFITSLSQQAHNPRSLSDRMWMRDAFEDHPYGGNVQGSVRSISAITREDLVGFAGQRLRRAGLVIGAVGDITAAELSALIDQVFGELPAVDAETPVAETRPAENGGVLITRQAVPQSAVTFGQVGPKRDDPDWYAARLVNDVLGGGGFRGRLMREIREKRGLAYGVSTELVSFRHAGLILGTVATENARVAEAIALIRAQWQRMRDEGPSEAELDLAKEFLIGSFPLSLDTSVRVASLLVEIQLENLGIDYLDRRAALFGGVTLDQAKRVARGLLDPERLSFAVVGDPADLTATRIMPDPGF